MKNFLLFTALVLFSQASYGQIIGWVLEKGSNGPVAYANIGVKGTSKGTVSSEDGRFELDIEQKDVLLFSAIGYEKVESTFSQGDTIFLKPISYAVPTVEIKVQQDLDRLKLYGRKNKNRGESIAFGSPQLGACLGAPIQIKEKVRLESLNFVINHAKGDSMLFRVQLYAFKDGEVGEPLLQENLYIKEKQRKGVFSIDVSEKGLILEDDVVLSLEWLRDFDEKGNKGLTFDTKKGKKHKGIYYKYSNTDSWKKMKHVGKRVPCFYIKGYPIKED